MKKNGITTDVTEKFIDYFNACHWEYTHHEDDNVLIATNEKLPHIKVTIVCKEPGFSTFFELPLGIEEETKIETMEYITRVNLDIDFGTFKMDLSEGTIVFASYTNTTDLKSVPDAFINLAILIPLRIILQFIPGLYEVITGKSNAETAYKKMVEGEQIP